MVFWIPRVWSRTGKGEREYDLFSRLLEDRIIFIGNPIDDTVANSVIAQLLFLQKDNRHQDIQVFINSPGGYVTSGLAIYDTMQYVQPDVATYCLGQASSMASVILAAGTKGKRFALSHARIMLHQPSGGAQGTAADIEVHAEEILKLKASLNKIFSVHTGKSVEEIETDSDRDYFMSPEEALEYGIVDEVITTLKEPTSEEKSGS
jgi:ATP-dependent Clp protease protease subunit